MTVSIDLGAIFSQNAFAVEASYTPPGMAPGSSKSRAVDGVFTQEYVEALDVSGLAYVFRCPLASVQDCARGARLSLNGQQFAVKIVQRDTAGSVKLVLEEL